MTEREENRREGLRLHGWIGLAIIGISEILLFGGVPLVATFFTPFVWTGFILFMDSLVYRQGGTSWVLDRRRELVLLLPASIGFWLVFEFYNLFLRNWHYVGLPDEPGLRLLGYAWAFATIWPAILVTAQAAQGWKGISGAKVRPWRLGPGTLCLSMAFGAFCLVIPLVVPSPVAHYLAAPVWLGFVFFLDPLNYWMGRDSLFLDLRRGDPRRVYSLLLSGTICGFLWEFWNFWAGARWYYTVPILGHLKLFEMPVLGYLGFPPFALECFVMYSFLKNLLARIGLFQ